MIITNPDLTSEVITDTEFRIRSDQDAQPWGEKNWEIPIFKSFDALVRGSEVLPFLEIHFIYRYQSNNWDTIKVLFLKTVNMCFPHFGHKSVDSDN